MEETPNKVKTRVQLPAPLPAPLPARRVYRPEGRAYSSEREVISVITFAGGVQVSATEFDPLGLSCS